MKKLKSAILWLVISAVTVKTTQLVTSYLIMRVINPEEYGNAALSLSVLFAFQGVSSLGFDAALIQKKHSEHLFSAAWTLELFKSIILSLCLIVLIPVIIKFTKTTDNAEYLYLVCITILVDGLKNIGIIVYRKNLDFKKQFVYEYIPILLGSFYTIFFIHRNPSGLVVVRGFLVARILTLGLSYLMSEFRPKITYNLSYFKELFVFGFWITINSTLAMIRTQGINMLIPRYFSANALGIYNRSQAFSEELVNQFSNLVWKLGFPLLSKEQEEGSLSKRYFQFIIAMSLVLFPVFYMTYSSVENLVRLFFDKEWYGMIPIIQLLSLASLSSFLSVPSGIFFQSIGRPQINTYLNIANVTIISILVLSGLNGSVTSVVSAFAISAWVVSLVMFGIAVMLLGISFKKLIFVIGPIASSAACSFVLYLTVTKLDLGLVQNLLSSAFCGLIYVLVLIICRRKLLIALDKI